MVCNYFLNGLLFKDTNIPNNSDSTKHQNVYFIIQIKYLKMKINFILNSIFFNKKVHKTYFNSTGDVFRGEQLHGKTSWRSIQRILYNQRP